MMKSLLVALALGAPLAAQAEGGLVEGECRVTPNSGCSMPAVGRDAIGRCWAGSAARMQVDANGGWFICQPWVADGQPPARAPAAVPAPCKSTRVSWTIDGKTCAADLPPAGHGFSSLATQEIGAMRGQATYVCDRGTFALDSARSHCADAPACDLEETIRWGSEEACNVTVDSRAAKHRVGTELALPADTKPGWSGSAVLRCEFGGWRIVRERCVRQQP